LKEVELRTSGKVKLKHGNALRNHQAPARGWMIVERRSRPAEADDDERRRYYRLTEKGREMAAAEAERMNEVLSIARARNLLKKPRTA